MAELNESIEQMARKRTVMNYINTSNDFYLTATEHIVAQFPSRKYLKITSNRPFAQGE